MIAFLLLVIGLLALVVAGGLYVMWNPQILGALAQKSNQLQRVIQSVHEDVLSEETGPVVDDDQIAGDTDRKSSERLEFLGPDHYVEMLEEGHRFTEYQVLGAITLHELRQYGSAWQKSGVTNPALYLEGDRLLLRQGHDWYLFAERCGLTADSVEQFRRPGQEFGRTGQTGDVRFTHDGREWRCIDVGRYEASVRGTAHLTNTDQVMFLLANCGEEVLLVENAKTGHDSVWVGHRVDPNEVVTKII